MPQDKCSIMRLAIGNDGQSSNAAELFTALLRLHSRVKFEICEAHRQIDGHRG